MPCRDGRLYPVEVHSRHGITPLAAVESSDRQSPQPFKMLAEVHPSAFRREYRGVIRQQECRLGIRVTTKVTVRPIL
jgi:hypothetical protein